MIIVVTKEGNHSNRLFHSIHLEAFAREHNCNFYDPTFSDLAHYYNISSHWYDRYLLIIFNKIKGRFKLKLHHFSEDYFIQHEPKFDILKKRIAFVSGWFFFQKELTLKYKDYFQRKYTLSGDVLNNILKNENYNLRKLLSKISDAEVVLGVHIRRGDYISWENGKYFYDDIVYQAAILKLKALCGQKKMLIIIFSNESFDAEFSEDTYVSNNKWYVDHYLMGLCDYLIGPPSTFTLWASYIGPKAKYFHMNHKNDLPVSLEDFKIYNG